LLFSLVIDCHNFMNISSRGPSNRHPAKVLLRSGRSLQYGAKVKACSAAKAAVLFVSVLLVSPLHAVGYQINGMHRFRHLTQAEAARAPSLKVQAFVNFYIPERNRLYIQYGADASYASPADGHPGAEKFRRGDLVEFTGHAEEGGLSPNVAFSSYRVLRHQALPLPPRMSAVQMDLPSSECHRARVAGRILAAYFLEERSGMFESGGLELAVGTPESKIEVMIDRPRNLDPAKLVGADVELEGTVAHTYQRGQFSGSMLFVQEAADLRVINPVQIDPFTFPLRKVSDLLRFGTSDKDGRVHLQGVVISRGLSESFFLQDASQGILVETYVPARLQPNDVVDVVGYPQPGQYSPVLRYAVFRKLPGSREPKPDRISSLEIPVNFHENYAASWLIHDAKLIEVEAELIGQRVSSHETSLLLRSGKIVFSAKLQGRDSYIENLETGSFLRLRGVCTVLVAGVHRRPDGMELLLRSRADLDVLRTPPWWTGTRLAWMLSTAGACVVLLGGWICTLRLQVRAQTKQLLDRATRDALTKVWNRAEILNILGRQLELARKQKSPLTITLIDLDHFKSINDSYGHQAGDAVLVEICARFSRQIRCSDAIGRYGGEEFLIVQPGLQGGSDRTHIERLRQAAAQDPVCFEALSIPVTCSLGASWCTEGSATLDDLIVDDLIKAADAALYRAKRNGRNRAEFQVASGTGASHTGTSGFAKSVGTFQHQDAL